nr:protein FAR1-related sequence 5 [Tanacetum cinerariifolium]
MDKRKRFKLNMEIFKDIFKICPRVQGQDFDALSTNEEIVSFLRELRHTREIISLNDVVVDHMHQPWRTFAVLIYKSLSRKTTESDLEENKEDEDDEVEVKDEFVKTPSNDHDDKAKSDEDEEMDYTTRAQSSVSQNSVSSDVVVESSVPSGTVLNASTEEIIAYEKETYETHAVKKLDALCTPESFVTHSNFDTPGGTVYYIPKVYADVLLVKRNVYDLVDDCVIAYMKYAIEVGFVVRRSCQKRMLNKDVKQKYLVCKRMGCLKGIHVETLDLGNSDKQKRNSNLHITGCKARVVLNLDPHTREFVLNVFDTIYNHELEHEEEFRDVVSFDATFKTNKYKMVFVPFTVIDNYIKYVTIVAGLLKNVTTKYYIWLLKAFIKSFGKAPSIVVTDQDGAMRNAIEAEFGGSKHRLCMWHITQKLPAKKEIFVGLWHCEIDSKSLVEGSEVLQNIEDGSVVCLCLLFVRVGILCKHIFCVFKNANVEIIPQQYILRRWTKNLILAALRNKRNRYGKKNVVVENYANEKTLIVDHCVHLLSKDEPRLGTFVKKLKSLKKEVEADCPNPPSKNKTNNLEQLVGVLKPHAVDVNNPTVGSTKGRKKLRIKGGKEKAIEKSLKGINSCSLCDGTDHNKKTCPLRFEVQDKVVVQKEACQREVVVQK